MSAKPVNQQELQATVVFFYLPGLFALDANKSFAAILALHAILGKAWFPKSAHVLSAAAGAIVQFPDDGDGPAAHRYFEKLCDAFRQHRLPVKIGVTHGKVEYFEDVQFGTFIGRPVNFAARLATAKDNPGILFHESCWNHAPDDDSMGPDAGHAVEVKGKPHDPPFRCFLPKTSPPVVRDFAHFVVSAEMTEIIHKSGVVNSLILAVDLPGFSAGTHEVLSKRFRGFVAAAEKALVNSEMEKLYYSPGGDGGIFVFPNIGPGWKADTVLQALDQALEGEASLHQEEASILARVGAHYGPVPIYRIAEGREVPTGLNCYIAEQVANDVDRGSIACSATVFDGFGAYSKTKSAARELAAISVGTVVVKRYLLWGRLKEDKTGPAQLVAGGIKVPAAPPSDEKSVHSAPAGAESSEVRAGGDSVGDEFAAWLESMAEMFCDAFLAIASAPCKAAIGRAMNVMLPVDRDKLKAVIKSAYGRVSQEAETDAAAFDRMIVELENIAAEQAMATHETARVRDLQDLLFQLGFPPSLLTRLGNQLKAGGLVFEESAGDPKTSTTVANHIGAELVSKYLLRMKPEFLRSEKGGFHGVVGEGLIHYVPLPPGNPDPKAMVCELLKGMATELFVTLSEEEPAKSIDEQIEHWAGELTRMAAVKSNLRRGQRAAIGPRLYCVVAMPKEKGRAEELIALLRMVNKRVPALAFFITRAQSRTRGTEEIVLQIVKERFKA